MTDQQYINPNPISNRLPTHSHSGNKGGEQTVSPAIPKLPSAIEKMKTIAEVHAYYQKIISCMPNNVYWLDNHCVTQGCNNNVLKFIGLQTLNEFVGITYEEMGQIAGWTEGHSELYKQDDIKVMTSGEPQLNVEEPPIHDPEGHATYYLTSRVPIVGDNEEIVGVVGISVDITKRKEMEETLRHSKIAAEAANQAKTEFIANMSHDIRTPLSGVVGMAELLEQTLQNPNHKQQARWLRESGVQLLNMLNGILDVISADQVREPEPHEEYFDLRQFINDLVQLERPSTTLKQLDLQITIAPNVPTLLLSDRTKLHRILLNILGNAIKFTSAGTVSLQIECPQKNNGQGIIQFSIIDTGIGIPLALQQKVFDRFFRVSPSYKGLYSGQGIGLHIAQSYVNQLGSTLDLQSEEGVGTTVSFSLTCLVMERVETAVPTICTALLSTLSPHAPHLLLVEDQPIALQIVESMASAAGFHFTSAIDGEQALTLATTQSFDLIMTDIGLPGMSGHEFTRRFRQWEQSLQKPPCPIIGLTAHARLTAEKECLASGMNDVFSKPVNVSMLQRIVKQWVVQKQHSSLGVDLPATEANLFELDALPLFDPDLALVNMGDNQTLRLKILHIFVNATIPEGLEDINIAYTELNWSSIEHIAHQMKSAALYSGAVQMKQACQYLERYRKAGHTSQLNALYEQLIRVAAETQQAVLHWLQHTPS